MKPNFMRCFSRFLISLALCIVTAVVSVAQHSDGERLTPLHANRALKGNGVVTPMAKVGKGTPLSLPFIDDFSSGHWYPNPAKWADRNVYINNHYSTLPPTVGIATFDALDSQGEIYSIATAFPFSADTLTSLEIDLSGYRQSDSIFFSFFYQPQGIGNAPERDDSLLLEFWSPDMEKWFHVWGDRGRSLNDFVAHYGMEWRGVVVPVDSALFFSPEFRFRFRNFASITDVSLPDWGGNVDMWHLDYVVLDDERSIFDTLIQNDIAFRDYPKSLLKRYVSMPWNQYLANPTGEMLSNLDSIKIPWSAYYYNTTNPVLQSFTVTSLTGGAHYNPSSYSFGNLAMPVDMYVRPNPNEPLAGFTFTAPSQPYADFEIKAAISPFSASEKIKTNDTVRFYQKFYNYYAYDDGTAEAGYGMSSSNPNAKLSVALKFDLNVPDTLRGVQIFFNSVKDHANDEQFTLTVWDDNGGEPGDTLYTEDELRPVFLDGINNMPTFVLTRPLPLDGTFWVGWQQKSGIMLNVGYDLNSNSKEHLRYNIGSGWNSSLFDGAVMIRPVLGDSDQPYIGINKPKESGNIKVYPNPANDILYIGGIDGLVRVEFFNIGGQMVFSGEGGGSVDVSALRNGFYYAVIYDGATGVSVAKRKIIIAR